MAKTHPGEIKKGNLIISFKEIYDQIKQSKGIFLIYFGNFDDDCAGANDNGSVRAIFTGDN